MTAPEAGKTTRVPRPASSHFSNPLPHPYRFLFVSSEETLVFSYLLLSCLLLTSLLLMSFPAFPFTPFPSTSFLPPPICWFPQLLVRDRLWWFTKTEMDEVSAQRLPNGILTKQHHWPKSHQSVILDQVWWNLYKVPRTVVWDGSCKVNITFNCSIKIALYLRYELWHWIKFKGLQNNYKDLCRCSNLISDYELRSASNQGQTPQYVVHVCQEMSWSLPKENNYIEKSMRHLIFINILWFIQRHVKVLGATTFTLCFRLPKPFLPVCLNHSTGFFFSFI